MEPFEKKIQDYTKTVQERCVRESAVMETVRKSTDAFVLQEVRNSFTSSSVISKSAGGSCRALYSRSSCLS